MSKSNETMSRSQFAKHIDVTPAYISQLGKQDRIVMDGNRVLVEESIRRIQETGGSRKDVADRFKKERAAKEAHPTKTDNPKPSAIPSDDDDSENPAGYQESRALKEKYNALQAKVNYETLIGNLIPKDDVLYSMKFIGSTLFSLMEMFPGQNAAVLAQITDVEDMEEHLADACRSVQMAFGDAIERQAKLIDEGLA